ncbi:MAG: glutamate racemase [Bacillota bacterium]
MSSSQPIGFFDSGVGGISVMKEVRRLLPVEDLLYFADSLYCPYGNKSPELIRQRARLISSFLLSLGAKMIVVASNTTSVAALNEVRQSIGVPVVGTEPAVKPATCATRNGRIGVLATGVTLAGERFNSLVERFGEGVEVYTQPCPGLVETVEAGRLEHPDTEELLRGYLDRLLSQGVDTIVLGCTHYPFLRPLIEKLVGDGVTVIDTGQAVAKQVYRVLESHDLLNPHQASGREHFYTSTHNPVSTQQVIRQLWKDPHLTVKSIYI